MYTVRIDKDGEGYVFKVQPAPAEGTELVALDSVPGIIAVVHAVDPGADEPIEALDGNRLLELIGKP